MPRDPARPEDEEKRREKHAGARAGEHDGTATHAAVAARERRLEYVWHAWDIGERATASLLHGARGELVPVSEWNSDERAQPKQYRCHTYNRNGEIERVDCEPDRLVDDPGRPEIKGQPLDLATSAQPSEAAHDARGQRRIRPGHGGQLPSRGSGYAAISGRV